MLVGHKLKSLGGRDEHSGNRGEWVYATTAVGEDDIGAKGGDVSSIQLGSS